MNNVMAVRLKRVAQLNSTIMFDIFEPIDEIKQCFS